MPRRRPPGVRTERKLSKEEERRLIDEYGIRFQGPVLTSQWPTRYSAIFSKIRDLETIKYEEYRSGADSCPHRVQRIMTLNRVHTLIRAAEDCRISSLNEGQWRRSTETPLLQQFVDEIDCHACQNRLRVAEFRVSRDGPPTPSCICNPNEIIRAELSSSAYRPFKLRMDPTIVDNSIPQIGTRKPDAVIGIRRDNRSKEMLRNHTDVTSSPVKEDPEILFPFLILEAKSEENASGFQSIETQTAFPIRTLLNIQKSLSESTQIHREPLVWFLAFRGELWNVYACYPDGWETKIIELWHGSIIKPDSALQLYLVVDLIYDWAIDLYQKEIFHCLSAGFPNVALTDGGSPESTIGTIQQEVGHDYGSDRSSLTYAGGPFVDDDQHMSELSNDCNGVADAIPMISEPLDDIEMQNADLSASNRITPTLVADPAYDPGETSVIRNMDEVFFTFHHLILPDTKEEMTAILASIRSNSSIVDTAANLLRLFSLDDPVVVTNDFISQIQELWTGTSDHFGTCGDELVLTHISFRSYFRPTDWQSLRSLSCITASIEAINTLGAIVLGGYDSILDVPLTQSSGLTADIVRPLRDLSGQVSTAAAVEKLCLGLQKEGSGYVWKLTSESGRYMAKMWKALDTNTPRVPLFSILLYSSARTVVEREIYTELPSTAGHVRLSRTTQNGGVLILKRPASWPPDCPKYCLAVFDGSDISDCGLMCWKILQALSNVSIYPESGHGVPEADRTAIQTWAKTLRDPAHGSI